MTATPKPQKAPKKVREPQKFTVTLLPMTEQEQMRYYRNLVQAGERIRAEREASHAAD